jgi:predicted enzyme related to lactoylglutathione lyase
MRSPQFRKIDAYLIKTDDLEAAVAFHGRQLGHPVIWRTPEAVAFGLPETDTELVVHANLASEVDLLVADVGQAYHDLIVAGAKPLVPPFEIPIGRCARVEDPFGNRLTILDQSKGALATDSDQNVVGIRK